MTAPALPIVRTLDAIAADWIAVLALVGLGLVVWYAAAELRRLRLTLEPIATSPVVRLAVGIGG